jgi:hypothetical protein
MNEPALTDDPRPKADPRSLPDFELRHYPRVNGVDPPAPDAAERNDRIKREFAAAYYALNCEHARMIALRSRPDSIGRGTEEKTLLQKIERLLIARDELEDFYAPFGVIAEPVVKEGFAVDLNISFGNVDAFGRLRSDYYTITACVPIPLPEGIKFDQLLITIEGPGIRPPTDQER